MNLTSFEISESIQTLNLCIFSILNKYGNFHIFFFLIKSEFLQKYDERFHDSQFVVKIGKKE